MRPRVVDCLLLAAAALAAAACAPSRDELIAQHSGTIGRYCLDCHSHAEQTGGLSLEGRSLASIAEAPAVWEAVARKLRAGMMPPADRPRPDQRTYGVLAAWIEGELDRTLVPRLPAPALQPLNRFEYANVIRDLLALEVDGAQFLPPDDSSGGFDHQAGTLGLSAALLDAYLSAAGTISRLALGRVSAPTQALYPVAEDATQHYHVAGLPFGTRGGILIDHTFPADGEYVLEVFAVTRGRRGDFRPFGEVRGEQVAILVDGERAALVDWDERFGVDQGFEDGGPLRTIDLRVPLTAGPHEIGVTFVATNFAPSLDLNRPFERATIATGGLPGFTFYPHVGSVRIDGPFHAAGAADSPSRRAVLSCRPASEAEEEPCAQAIIARLARHAFRGFDTEQDRAVLLDFYRAGHAADGFEAGIENVLRLLLSDPKLLYRVEAEPVEAAPGEIYRLGGLELASRLSFFLWSSIPDEKLLAAAEQGVLDDPAELERQVLRMLDDPRAAALTRSFAGQWLNLRALDAHVPAHDLFPDFDDNLRRSFRRETELLFESVLREDRSVLDLLTADYTFVDERLAKHYGIPGIMGSRFRRVTLGPEHDLRRGLLGKGSLLTVSSHPARTSPVTRGYWVLEHLLGVPPPPAPPDVPELEPAVADVAGNRRQPSMREQLERHRDAPACSRCHGLMDPIGLALEPFDAIGRARADDNGAPIDASGMLYDGTRVNGPAGVREFLLTYREQYVRTVAEKLLTYAVGRAMEHADMPFVRQIAREAAAQAYRSRALMVAVVQSAPFRMSTKSDGPSVTAAPAPAGGATEEAEPPLADSSCAAAEPCR